MNNSSSPHDEPHVLYDAGRYAEAFVIYREWADRGSVEALVLVGWMLQKGLGVPQDLAAAYAAYGRAAELGSLEASFRLGTLHRQEGRLAEALKCFEAAAARGYAPAIYRLGRMHQLGKAVKQDKYKAFQYFRDAAGKGHVFALRHYAALLLRGSEGLSGRIRGLALFLKALALGVTLGVKDPTSERLLE